MSEYRIKRNRRRRQLELRRNYLITAVVCILILSCVTGFGSMITRANSSSEHTVIYKYYKSIEISSGDSLWDLAQEYNNLSQGSHTDYIKEVKQMNHLKKDTIYSGQNLVLPYYSEDFLP